MRALRGLVRLKSLVNGPTVKRQTASTLKCMQTLSRVQSQIQSRRLRMLEENRALQRQLLQKRAKELESLRVSSFANVIAKFMKPLNISTLTNNIDAIWLAEAFSVVYKIYLKENFVSYDVLLSKSDLWVLIVTAGVLQKSHVICQLFGDLEMAFCCYSFDSYFLESSLDGKCIFC